MNKKIPEIRRYDIRMPVDDWHAEKGEWLGTFVITHDGLVQVFSDYGKYAHWWGSTGCDDIREFLLQIDTGYLLGKFASEREYYGDETKKAIKEHIIGYRKTGAMSKEEAREEWDRLEDLGVSDSHEFGAWMQETEIDNAWEFAHYGSPRQAVAFAERVWPVFCDALRAEMRTEKEEQAKQVSQTWQESA